MHSPQIANAAALAGRFLLSLIFIIGGFNKIAGYAGTAAYMARMGVPSILLPLVILTELGGGLLVLVGYQTKIVSLLMAGFALLSGLLFHLKLGDAADMIQFWKNVAIAGGFLSLTAFGGGGWSLDGLRKR
jgi:putative oxidoreductase